MAFEGFVLLPVGGASDDDAAVEAGSLAGGVAPLDGSFGALFDGILSPRLSAGDLLADLVEVVT